MSGDPYPEKIKKCINSWKEKLPDYEIRLWDANSFDINQYGLRKLLKQSDMRFVLII